MSVRGVLIAGAAALVVAGGAGGYWAYRHGNDPVVRAAALSRAGDLRGAQVELRNALRSRPEDPALHLQMARVQMKLGDSAAAERALRQAASLGADRWGLIADLGDALIAQGRFREALAQVPARGADAAQSAHLLLLRAIAQLALNDQAGATATLAAAQALAPEQAETALIAARLAASRNDVAGFEAKLDDVLRREPDQVEALVSKAKLLAGRNDSAGAVALLNRAVALSPWLALPRIDRAHMLIVQGDDAGAQRDVNAVLEAQPRSIDAVYLNAILTARKGKYADAAVQLSKLDGLGSRFPQGMYYQALTALNLNQLETAADYARRYVQLVPRDPDGQRLLAQIELAAKRPQAAVSLLSRAAGQEKPDGETLDLLGRAQLAAGQISAATTTLARAVAVQPDNAVTRAEYGVTLLQSGKAAEAAVQLRQALAIQPSIPGADEALVSAELAQGDVAKADAALAAMRAKDGDTEPVRVLAAQIELVRGKLDSAQAQLREIVRLFPDSLAARMNLASIALRQGQRSEAAALLREVLARSPAHGAALGLYLPMLVEDGQMAATLPVLEAARKAAPSNPALTAMLADAYLATGLPDRALSLLDGTKTQDGVPAVLLPTLARTLITLGRLQEGIDRFREALAIEPRDTVVRGQLADALLQLRDYAGVRGVLQDGLALDPASFGLMTALVRNEAAAGGVEAGVALAESLAKGPEHGPGAALLKGDVLRSAHRDAEAAEAYLAAFGAAPSGPLLMRAAATLVAVNQDERAASLLRAWLADHPDTPDAILALAQIDLRAKRTEAARAGFERVIASRPNSGVALNNLAWIYQQAKDGRAREMAQRAYLAGPTPEAADTLGWILLQGGDARAALPLLQRAAERRPGDPGIAYHLAVALKEDGRREEAAAALRPVLASGGSFDERPAAQALSDALGPN